MKKYLLIFLCVCATVQAQEHSNHSFAVPFDFPLLLSGNFGELRSNHFHGGVDFKTQGAVGKSLHCIADGYVSRVTVSAGGYGNALYITHNNGYTSVYGHLLSFAAPIADYVKKYQYDNETFVVDLYPDSTLFVFKKGDRIALAGNSGYSFGPHLHMEIRKTATNELIDPLQFYKKQVKDTRPPVAREVMFYPRDGEGVVNISSVKQALDIKNPSSPHVFSRPVSAWGKLGVGIKAYDYMDDTSNTYGVQSVTLYVDSVEIFASTVSHISFDENRMINSWTDFAEFRQRKSWFMKSFIEPGNTLRILRADSNRGIVEINEERPYHFMYVLKDLYGNTSRYKFTVQGVRQDIPPTSYSGKHRLRWNKLNIVQEPGMHLIIPRKVLYDDINLNVRVYPDSDAVSFIYHLHDVPVPLHRSCDLLIGVRNMPVADTSKYYIGRKEGSRLYYAGGEFEDGWVRASVFELGDYRVAVDTIPPKVEPINQANWKRSGVISYRVSDKETGIRSYKGTIDERFAIFAYDAKSGRLTCKPEAGRLDKRDKHTIRLAIEDNCGNITYQEDFF